MTPCICGHAEFLHGDSGCLKWFLSCGCPAYQADDGTEPPAVIPKTETYQGIYARRYIL